jgi:uncharacterized membrane protein (UPF0127 family)
MVQKKVDNPTRTKKSNLNLKLITIISLVVISAVVITFIITKISQEEKSSATKNNTQIEETKTVEFEKEGELTFNTADSKYITSLEIEIAEDNSERSKGLMFRKNMLENQGMLFIFSRQEFQSFWMRNTAISLDIIFVNSNNEIVTIHKNTNTFSDESYPSTKPAIYVVEVVADYTSKYGIKVGDKIVWRRTK